MRKSVARIGRGFTLVELLVVITIIGILIALLLPAVQAAREAARQSQCKNNLKQIAMACLNHESATKRFPTGGWGFAWTGDADRGTDWRQPGGWIYNILPFLEQQSLHDVGTELGGPADQAGSPKCNANLQRLSVPMTVLYCPTRRPVTTYPWIGSYGIVNAGQPSVVTRSDYAGNGGDQFTSLEYPNYASGHKLRRTAKRGLPQSRKSRTRREVKRPRRGAPLAASLRRPPASFMPAA